MFSDYVPKFVKHFAEVGEIMKGAFAEYTAEVKGGTFPTEAQTYGIADDVLEKLY